MDERQMTVCAIALFVDGYSKYQVADALGVDIDRAQELIEAGADAQANGEMGQMARHRAPWSRDAVHGPDYSHGDPCCPILGDS